jgi:curli biogenesis system outer membrane secretion channel CsgG
MSIAPRISTRMTLLLLAGLALLPLQSQAQADRRPTVAVLYFTNGALVQHDSYEPLTRGIADALVTELQRNESVRVVPIARLQQLLKEQKLAGASKIDPETAVRIGRLLGAQHVVTGSFVVDMRGRLRIDARAVSTETSEVEHVETVNGRADGVKAAATELAGKMSAGMRLPGSR